MDRRAQVGALLHARRPAPRLHRGGVPADRGRRPGRVGRPLRAGRQEGHVVGLGRRQGRARAPVLDGPSRRPLGGRNDFARIYDLTERVIPARRARPSGVPEHEARKELLDLAARHHGVGTFADLTDYHRQETPACKPLVDELVEEGGCVPVQVEGWTQAARTCTPRRQRAAAHQRGRVAQPVRPGGVAPRPHRAAVRLPLPDRDLHAAAEAASTATTCCRSCSATARRPARPEGRPPGRHAAGAGVVRRARRAGRRRGRRSGRRVACDGGLAGARRGRGRRARRPGLHRFGDAVGHYARR